MAVYLILKMLHDLALHILQVKQDKKEDVHHITNSKLGIITYNIYKKYILWHITVLHVNNGRRQCMRNERPSGIDV